VALDSREVSRFATDLKKDSCVAGGVEELGAMELVVDDDEDDTDEAAIVVLDKDTPVEEVPFCDALIIDCVDLVVGTEVLFILDVIEVIEFVVFIAGLSVAEEVVFKVVLVAVSIGRLAR
jgi:hypothetical protein